VREVAKTGIKIRQLIGTEIIPYIPDLAYLRIRIFREFPYLYDGTEAYEDKYLRTYSESHEAIVILALDDNRIIGASTGVPMAHETDTFKKPFIESGYEPAKIFYCGESVLLPGYRGMGIYKQFIQGREVYARSLKRFDLCCFCTVDRPDDHPLKPTDYESLDAVWNHYGYCKMPELLAHVRWKDIDQPEETEKPMVFWIKKLN
jgi:hypothetical protein